MNSAGVAYSGPTQLANGRIRTTSCDFTTRGFKVIFKSADTRCLRLRGLHRWTVTGVARYCLTAFLATASVAAGLFPGTSLAVAGAQVEYSPIMPRATRSTLIDVETAGARVVVVGERDRISPPAAMERRVEALRRSGTVVEYHEYEKLGHGFGPGTGTSAEGWVSEATRFWERFIRR